VKLEMNQKEKMVKLAVNGGISFGAKLNPKQLAVIAELMNDGDELELTTFQQLYIEVPESKVEFVKEKFKEVGLSCYSVGNFVKSLRTCNFCKGEEEEGMPVAKELNRRITGKPVPFTLKIAYTGCPIGCGEPMLSDIGVMKFKDHYNLYVGGKAKGREAEVGYLLKENLTPAELYDTVEKIIATYSRIGKKRETFFKFWKRVGKDQLIS
jgi:dissimilatory sulfite reductase (desulfoviridin) alpha/beta subunit